jgi:4-amino-4-deoxy-L-arabinose transferase-like glycosyltransferase
MTTISHPGIGTDVAQPRLGALVGRLLRGRAEDGAWVRPAHVSVSLLAAALYLVNLTVSGFANTYYSAAALAASKSWSAWFFGSFDAANFITIDKPPLATMLMGLSVRLFGLSSWSILLPEALAGVATVALLFVVVRRSFGPVAAVIAALVMALTPAAVLMFRYNNPDALLTLLLVLAGWAFLRAVESGSLRWVVAAAVFVGLAFNTKYLQAYLVLPAFAITYAIAAPVNVRRRVVGLVAAAAAVVLSSGWWVLAVELLPAAARPYIGGSTTNSAVQLLLGYDGLGRIFGSGGAGGPGGGPGGRGGGGGGFSGATGLLRLLNAQLGGQVGWLIPFSFAGLAAGLWLRRWAPRTDRARAGYLMWGLWLAVHALVFSFMSGIIHSYYAVAMAPAIGALVGAGAVDLWALRTRARFGGLALAGTILVSALLAWQLLERTPGFVPGLGLTVLFVGTLVAAIVTIPSTVGRRRTQLVAAALGVAVLLAGPAAYALDTMGTAYAGGDPKAGPATADGGPGGFAGGTGIGPGVGPAGVGRSSGGAGVAFAARPNGQVGAGDGEGASAARALIDYLLANRKGATWIVATTSANEAGSIQLASGEPVMAMGGFSGSDPAPTLEQLKALVASGQVRYVLIGGGGPGGGQGGGPGGGRGSTSDINAWVTSAGTAVDYGGSRGTLYDLSGAAARGA